MNQPTSPLFNVWDEAQQKEVQLPYAEAQQKLFDPKSSIGLIPGKKYYFRGENNSLLEAENPEDIFDNVRFGVQPVDEGLAKKEIFADTIPGQLAALGTGALRGATAGLSDVGIVSGAKALEPIIPGATKATQDTLNSLSEVNPYTSAVGNVGGTVAGLFSGAPVLKAIGLAGEAVQGTKIVSGLANLLSKVPVVGGALSYATKLAAGSAVEGWLFGAGRTLSEESLGKAPDVSEALLANTKNDALIGAGIGGGLGAIGGAAGSTINRLFAKKSAKAAEAAQAESKIADQAEQILNEPIGVTNVPDQPGILPGAAAKVDEAATSAAGQKPKASPSVPQATGTPPVETPLPSNVQEFVDTLGKKILNITGNTKNISAADQAGLDQIFTRGSMTRKALVDPKKFKEAFHNDLVEAANQLDANAEQLSKGLNEAIDNFAPDINQSIRAIDNINDVLFRLKGDVLKKPSEYQARQLSIIDLAEKRLQSLIDNSTPDVTSTTRNVFKDLREFKQELFEETTAGLRSASKLTTQSDKNAAKVYDEIYGALNKNLKDPSIFGDVGESLAAVDNANRLRLLKQRQLIKDGVLKKDNLGYTVNDRAVQKVLADTRKRELFQDFLDADFEVKKAAATLESLTGKKLNLGDISPRASERVRAALQIQELFRNELTTGKSAIMGDILGAIVGTVFAGPLGGAGGVAAARAIGHVLENPGLVVQRLAQLSESAGRLGDALEGIQDATKMVAGLAGIKDQVMAGGKAAKFGVQDSISEIVKHMNAEDNLEAVRYMQMKDAEEAVKKTQETISKTTDDLIKKDPPTSIGPQSFIKVKPLTPESFVDLQSKLQTAEDVGSNVLNAMGETMPMVSRDLAQKANAAKSFLQSKLPPLVPDELGIERAMPDPQAIAKFSRYVDAVESPMGVMKNIAQGYVTPEGMETLRTVYPALWAQLQTQIKEKLKDSPSPKQRQVLAQILNGQSQSLIEVGLASQSVWSGQSQEQSEAAGAPSQSFSGGGQVNTSQKAKVSLTASNQPQRRGAQV